MGELIKFPAKGKFEVEYLMDENKIIGVTHPAWGFRIQRHDNKIALVSEANDEPFGELDRDVFNTIIGCWLMVDDINLCKEMAKDL